MPSARQGAQAAAIDGIVYVIGGYRDGTYLATVDAYDPASDTWVADASMPGPRYMAGGAVVDGVAYVIGGIASPTDFVATNEAFTPGVEMPAAADQCRNGGWMAFGVFRNQGDCVSYVATQGRNEPAGSP